MVGQNVRCYTLNIANETDDPMIFGPYTERRARALAEQFNNQIEAGTFEGEGWMHATAMRIWNPTKIRDVLAEFGKEPR